MDLTQMQRALAKLYTDPSWRKQFFVNPQAVGEAWGLSATDTQQMAQLQVQQVDFFAGSLQRKRLNEICKLLPLSHRVLGKRFAELFRRYAETHLPKGAKQHQEDVIAFVTYVEDIVRNERLEPAWVVELLRYEKARLIAARPARRLTVRWFGCAINKLVQSLAQEDGTPCLIERPSLALWFRFSRQARLRQIILSLPLGH